MKQALILAGGKGNRLSSVSFGLPKPMVRIAGRPVLEYAIEKLVSFGISDLHFFIGHGSQVITEYFGDGKRFAMKPSFHVEEKLLGTAGAVVRTLPELDEEFLVIYGDTIFNIDISKLVEFHRQNNSDVTLFLHPNDHPSDSDLVEIDKDYRITAFHKCPHSKDQCLSNLVSAAMYVIKKEVLLPWALHQGELDFARDIFPTLIAQKHRMFGYVSREYIKDMGTPGRLKKAESDVLSGKVENGSFSTQKPAIFLDRDGTLVRHAGYICRPEQLILEEHAAEAVRMINESEYLSVLVTNQPVVARGEVSEDGLKQIHNKMEQDLGQQGAYLNAIYYCPHHPDKGFAGERPEYKVQCKCRKPGTELIERATKDLNIKSEDSWVIGDSSTDIMTAKNAGLKSILVRTGLGGHDGKYTVEPDFKASNLLEAIRLIVY